MTTINNTIRLRCSLYLDLADPQPDQFTIQDIAGALSKICRFGGQIEDWYSVAEHSWWCAEMTRRDGCGDEACAAVLMHDAAEAFIGDVVKPLKIMLTEYAEIESRMERVIAEKFGIDFEIWKSVIREIDQAMLIAERRQLFSADGVLWTGENEVRVIDFCPHNWTPEVAENEFLDRAYSLGVGV